MKLLLLACLPLVSLTLAGCSDTPARLEQSSIAADAGQAAIAKHDQDGDKMLSGAELAKVGSLKSAQPRLDANQDGKLGPEEIDRRIQAWRNSKTALVRVVVTVRYDQRPLNGAAIKLVPEEFLGTELKPAQGTTNENGACFLMISENPDERGVGPGFYRIEISKKNGDKETLPAKYNAQSELGIEVASDLPGSSDFVLNLTSS